MRKRDAEADNAALRYLWARHRIALLSDYNRLRLRDERVREVTNLGLTYNLLTAYTSFIAVDTRVRLKEGQTTTVKQPLPLPQGVSDYAVGGKSHAKKAISSFAPAIPLSGLKGRGIGKELEFRERVGTAAKLEEDVSVDKKRGMTLEKISVTGGLAKEVVRKVLESRIRTLDSCYVEALEKRLDLKGKIIFKIFINATGRVTKVHMINGADKEGWFEQCMVKKLIKSSFPRPKTHKGVIVTVAFILK